jgi:hypothetical protein
LLLWLLLFLLLLFTKVSSPLPGLLLTLVIAVIFLVFGSTPYIKAAGRELSCFLLGGVGLSYGGDLHNQADGP